ncbi:MAG TPA: BrnA antitoxin family protein [Paracoccus sp. (in: a-proteobacteria)]|uniref:BrnA antitoxin family protein n=1 Tax=uncultured Paracoccus sp. TaxID=189685 RepID=UPI002627EE5A|nr:BrnA antitoxin family protein [uncultured Paracoccus sp.]HMQ41698.1 BrnA antitoxin family protein [Paracoccus sp. (in: a-proteobacteria)]HMR36708.1 BrnA antitoxin family protein [Paracoccus sp. (in: a-proteobacteria)]
MTRAETARRANYHYMADAMRRLEWDLHQRVLTEGRIPDAWHEIAAEGSVPKKERISIRLDGDVVKFFRDMGPGWQPRLNAVLRSFMHARLAGLLRGAETMDYLKRRAEEGLDGRKPGWGGVQAEYEDLLGEDLAREMSEEPGVPMGEETRGQREDLMAWMKVRDG